ncbi:tryptophan 7-halogenase [Cellvibrio sp. KY-GH-1]|uniref:tryptophan halogenase family protein n=1 Tax=Cellvibrio sp. KY-GH-1 TaxID=2303332 RepID=UPI0012477368|nr:tryptophan halogenase family protein [Cellvibrio sp. KY-GH-1]QEY18167.1 tryptophan 7-halogenase [Cellvibrio sp. KY-GH-1]
MIKKYVILGGGTAGWMTAAAFARFVSSENAQIVLIESDAIGTVGVGEATIPHIRAFNDMLGIKESHFMQSVNATYKLGIRFTGWGNETSDYYHPFGDHGFPIKGVGFHHYWLGAKNAGAGIAPFDSFSVGNVLAREKKFSYPSANPDDVLSTFSYAYHIDATAYAKLLRTYAEDRVTRIEGQVVTVNKNTETGFIESLTLASGQCVEGDLFIDCSGFRSRLLGQELGVEFQSWKKWLPCDSALAVPTEGNVVMQPYTHSTAKTAGWCWKIPLTHRIGNGHVFSSEFTNSEQALRELEANLSGDMIRDPALIKFEAGVREKTWKNNCIAIGLACGFLEPLESTSIYLVEVAILKLLELLPRDCKNCALEEDEFNRQMENEYLKVRDFIILHYALNDRPEEFWRHCANMTLPNSLQEKIDIFKTTAHVVEYDTGLFMPPSWLAVYLGQGLFPGNLDSRLTESNIHEAIGLIRGMPAHLNQIVSQLGESATSVAAHPPASRMSLYGIRR